MSTVQTMLHDMFSIEVPPLEKVLRTVAVYLFLVVLLRLAGKRELGQSNRFDLIVLLTLSNTLQNAIIGQDNSLLGGLLGAAVLIGINELANLIEYRHPRLQRLTEGHTSLLVKDGKVIQKAMDHERLSEQELLSACRKQSIERIEDIEKAILETNGSISIFPKRPTEDEASFDRLQQRLQRIEAILDARLPGNMDGAGAPASPSPVS